MSIALECKKLKRTGFISAFLGGAILASLVPIANMAVRWGNYVGLKKPPLQILLDANWQMMTMLNILLIVCGACIMYNTEYADNAMQKMDSLPIGQSRLFFSKFILLAIASVCVLFMEAASLAFCTYHWFSFSGSFMTELVKNTGYIIILTMPTVMLMLVIASACKNMWVSLGIGVIFVFTATIIPTANFILSLFPFALPFQTICMEKTFRVVQYICGAGAETVLFGIAGSIFLKARRDF